jgi:hypothetical protein
MSISASSQTCRTLCDRQFEAEATEWFGQRTCVGNVRETAKPLIDPTPDPATFSPSLLATRRTCPTRWHSSWAARSHERAFDNVKPLRSAVVYLVKDRDALRISGFQTIK